MMGRVHSWNSLGHAGAGWVVISLLLLSACGGNSPGGPSGAAGATPSSAEAIHEAFLDALRANDREQVLALTVDDQQAARAETWLRMIQSYMHSTTTEGPHATGGKLSAVEVVKLEDRGAARRGWSRWAYAQKTICHIAELAQTPRGWRVTSFHTTSAPCTADG